MFQIRFEAILFVEKSVCLVFLNTLKKHKTFLVIDDTINKTKG